MAWASCPNVDATVQASKLAPLLDRLAQSDSEHDGKALAAQIWQVWTTAPDAKAQALLDSGVQSIGWGALSDAETTLSALIAYCPDYAEGWNQRAFARFLQEDYDGAMTDLDRTLELEPKHFAALAGRGLTFLRQGQREPGFDALREATALHPWMNERHLLPPDEKI